MMLLNYSHRLEQLVGAWLKNCFDEFPDYHTHPEYAGMNYTMMTSATNQSLSFSDLKSLLAQREFYNVTTNNCSEYWCSDYKQMVWAASTEVGCSKCQCLFGGYFVESIACIFQPSGDLELERPYNVGKSCSGCPSTYRCYRKQCYLPEGTDTTTSISVRLQVCGILGFAMFIQHFFLFFSAY
uniref:SCP domain-containing protein n=1 Tax=Mesocestoides corti TaxID=53468 RepID=A0A5K3EH94_MESCO